VLESTVEILDLQYGRGHQDCDQEVCDGEGNDVPDGVGEQRCDTFGREGRVTTCKRALEILPSEGKQCGLTK
jgi:hypothetical protein